MAQNLLAYQLNVDDLIALTLITLSENDQDRDIWTSKWKDGSILPQRE
jgi:hypothetical protein